MPTIAGIDSFQGRIIPTAVNNATGWYSAVNNVGTTPNHGGGQVTFDTGVKRTADHACSLKIVTDNVTPANVRHTVASTMIVGSVYFRIPSAPASGSPKILNCALSAGVASIQVASNGHIQSKVGSGTQQEGTTNWADDAWHRLDWKLDTSTGTATLDVTIDGTESLTQATLSLASANITTVMLGDNTAAIAVTIYYSDLVWSTTSGDFPLGDHICLKLEIDGTGTHSQGSGAFADELGGTTDANLLDSVDDAWNGTTPELSQTGEDFVAQTANDANGYVEFTTANTSQSGAVWGAQLGVLMASLDSTTACLGEAKLVDSAGTTLGGTGSIDPSVSATAYTAYRPKTTAAPSGGWSTSSLNACKIRLGFSSDAAPDLLFNSAIIEYAAAWSASGGGQNLTGAVFARAGTFATGVLSSIRALTGAVFSRAPTFAAATLTTTRALSGAVFARAPTFGAGAVTQGTTLSGAVFSRAPSFGAGVVGRGAVNLAGSVFARAPTFPAGSISVGGGTQSLTGAVFAKAPTFPSGTVTRGAVNLAGAVFARAPTFPAGTIALAGALSQAHFRIRTGDSVGLNVDSGWAAALDANATIDAETVFRIRFEVAAAANAGAKTFKLQFRRNGLTWTDVVANTAAPPTSVDTTEIVLSSQYANDDATTNLLAGSGLTFEAGVGLEDNLTPSITLNGEHTEYEWALRIRVMHHNATTKGRNADGDTFEYRIVESNGTAFAGGYVTPTVTLNVPDYLIGGAHVETPKRSGPWKASNGDLYMCLEYGEANISDEFVMLKSTDGGKQWAAMDEANAPTKDEFADDLENSDGQLVGHVLHLGTFTASGRVRYNSFFVSTHPTNPDQWATVSQEVHTASSNPSDQDLSIGVRSDGSVVCTYSTDPAGALERIAYRIRDAGTNAWSAETILDTTAATSFSSSIVVIGENDLAYIIYHDDTNSLLYYKTLSLAGTLSGRTQFNASGTIPNYKAIPAAYYFDDAGDEVIVAVFRRTNNLWERRIINGTLQTERQISGATIANNRAGGLAPVAHMAVDGTNIHACWVDGTDPTLLRYDVSLDGAAYGTDVTKYDSATTGPSGGIDTLTSAVFTHSAGNGGATVMAVVIDDGGGGLTGYNVYREWTVAGATTPQSLVGAKFSKAPTFPTGAISTGAVGLVGATFVRVGGFPVGGLVRPATWPLVGALFSRAPTFGAGTLLPEGGTQGLVGTTFARAPTFPTGRIDPAFLTGSLFARAPTFPTGVLSRSGTLLGTSFLRAPTFAVGSLSSVRALSGAKFSKAPTFGVGSIVLVGGDPPGLTVTIVGSTAQLDWNPSPSPGVVDYSVFRRSPSTGAPFDPTTATPIATGITATAYNDTNLPVGSYDWQVFGRIP
ncbi:MAG TPA: hypothetical protein VFT76_00220 [Actinomycetota bacterium]|nr:hypothetical protein [Actinomycetota bacterium]